jgi:hypothetical protein
VDSDDLFLDFDRELRQLYSFLSVLDLAVRIVTRLSCHEVIPMHASSRATAVVESSSPRAGFPAVSKEVVTLKPARLFRGFPLLFDRTKALLRLDFAVALLRR